MAFFQLVLKARKLEKARLRYEDEKLRSIEVSKVEKPRLTLKQHLRQKKLRCRKKIGYFCSRITSFIKYTWIYKKVRLLRIDGTLENYILKSVFGFLGGIFLTYMFFLFFVIQLNFTLLSATMLCSVFGMILTLGLAFSYRVRCVVFLLLPQLFSKRGRQALMAYAFILTLTGPGKNALHNISVLTESLVCGQEQLEHAVKNVVDLIKQPFYALRDALSKVIKKVKMVVKRIKRTLVAMKRLVLSMLRVIISVFQWLGSIVNICNKKLGTPFDRCQGVFEGAVADCKAKFGPFFGKVCNLTYIVGSLCYIVKPLDFICMLVSYVADTIIDAVRQKIKRFTRHVRAMFYVKVKFSHSFHFETNQTKTFRDISANIITEIRSRTDKFLAVFDWMSFMSTFFILFMLLRIMHYRHKWLTNERFDNQYLTDDLRTIDLIRTYQNKETVLPLNHRERNQYIPLTSVTLVKIEKVKLVKSAVFLGLATFKICIHMMADYSLYWILSTIRYHGRIEMKVQRPNSVGVYVSGNGYLADLYRSIVKAFTPHAKDTEIDVMPCLPDPIPPDLDRYMHIMTLIVFCWIMTIFEPYGLRLRHIVMCKYYPERAKQRAAWLYNHIIRLRGSFLKFARRQLRRKFGMTEDEKIEAVTFRERCLAICPFLNKLFPRKQNMCLLCGVAERPDQEPHIKCTTPGCVGLFCIQCFADLQNLCTICRSPIEYGDLSDLSEEKDSSDDQLTARKESLLIVKEEKPEEVKIEEISEEKVSKEKMPEERILEEKISKERIPEEEMLEEKISEEREMEKIIIDKKDKAVQTDDDINDSSSESVYSYTYQEESPEEVEIECHKAPFKDIEAQKIREDVTIQIFNEPLAKMIISSSEDLTSCFVVRTRRKLRTRLKRKSYCSPRKDDSSSSTSIADTESWPAEELNEEEVIHIEMDDDPQKLLLKDGAAKEKKQSRVKRILAALTKMPWLGKRTTDSSSKWRTRKLSFMDRIVRMLPRNQSMSPVQTYRQIRTTKKDAKRKDSSSASSSSSDEENEHSTLLKTHDRQINHLKIISDYDDSENNIYSKNYDSHRARRRTICRQPDSRARAHDVKLKYPYEKKFATKKLPRYLQPVLKDTAYFEVKETKNAQSKQRCVRPEDRTNILPEKRTSVNSQRTDKWNITNDDYIYISCSCTSQIFYDVKEDNNICQSDMNAITEQSNEVYKTDGMLETDRELLTIDWERLDQVNKTGEIVTTERTSTDIETEVPEKVVLGVLNRRKSLVKSKAIAEEKNVKKYSVKKEQPKKLKVRKKAETSTSRGNDNIKAQLYDSLASLELGSVTYQAKRREKSAVEKLTKEPEAAETRIDGRKTAESTKFEASIEIMPKSTQITAHEIRESIEVPKKSTQMNLRKFKRYKKLDKTMHTDTEISKAPDLEERRGTKEEKKRGKWINKHKHHKRNESDNSAPGEKRKLCDKAMLIKEKQSYRERKQKRICSRDIQSQEYFGTRCKENFSRANRADDIRRQKIVPAFRLVTELRKNRQIQCSLRNKKNIQRRQNDICCLKFTKEPEVWSCNAQPQFKATEQIIHCNNYNYWNQHKSTQSSKTNSLQKKSEQMRKKQYDINVRETKLEIPMLKKYLPAYQTPRLIEELKEHDRMKLIQDREARRWTALNALRSTKDSPLSEVKSRNQTFCDASAMCDIHESMSRLSSVSTKLIGGNTLPYQETQTFKNVVCEFREKVIEAERSLVSLSQHADKCKNLRQLFPFKNEDRRGDLTVPKFDKTVNRFKPTYNKREEQCSAINKVKQRCQSESFSDISSFYSCLCKHHQSDISTSADETTDNNDDII